MILPKPTSASISRLVVSVLFLLQGITTMSGQGFLKFQKDTIPMFRGISVGADLVGLAQLQLSDYGQYEAFVRLNLHDQYFPIVELGYGRAKHENDDVTGISYSTSAPYFRVGCDVNIAKNKHRSGRIYAGFRYAFTSYKVDVARQPFPDPTWLWETSFGVADEPCSQHWAEVCFGLDTQVIGPVRLGWSVRYRQRLAHDDGIIGNTWYVPGFGKQDTSNLGATFNVMVDL